MLRIEDHLPALRELLLINGYHRTTLRMISKVLEISENEVYKEIGGKLGVVNAVISNEQAVWKSNIEEARSRSDSPLEIINALLKIIENEHSHRKYPSGSLLANLAGEFGPEDRDIQALIADQYDQIGKMLTDIIKETQLSARSNTNPRSVALFLLAAIEGSIMLAKSDNDLWEMQNGFKNVGHFLNFLNST